jgi:hypothetical protein
VTDWTQFSAIATGVGALVTGVSAGLIAWQAWETRRTAQAGRTGVEIGRQSLEVSQALAIDSTKARLDARAPRLLINAPSTHGEVVMGRQGSGIPQPWPLDRQFRRTEDDFTTLLVGTQIDVKNEGDRSQRICIIGAVGSSAPMLVSSGSKRARIGGYIELLRPEGANLTPNSDQVTIFLSPGERCEFRLMEARTVEQWAACWDAREEGDTNPSKSVGQVTCSDPYDEGVVDRWTIELYGCPIEPIPNDLAGWRIRNGQANPSVVEVVVLQQERAYYLSKNENRELGASKNSGKSIEN